MGLNACQLRVVLSPSIYGGGDLGLFPKRIKLRGENAGKTMRHASPQPEAKAGRRKIIVGTSPLS